MVLHFGGFLTIDHMFDILGIQSPGCGCSGPCPGKFSLLQDYLGLYLSNWLILFDFT